MSFAYWLQARQSCNNIEIIRLARFGKPNDDPTTPPSSSVLGTSTMPVRPHALTGAFKNSTKDIDSPIPVSAY